MLALLVVERSPQISGRRDSRSRPDVDEEGLTAVEARFRVLIAVEVEARAEAVKVERTRTTEIAELCVQAHSAGARMTKLAEFVRVLDKDGELQPVTRQAVDLMVAKHTGRERNPAPHQRRVAEPEVNVRRPGGVNVAAFGL